MTKDLTTSRLQINIMKMCQLGMIPKNGWYSGSLIWEYDGQEYGRMNFASSVGPHYAFVQFTYRITIRTGEEKDINQQVQLNGIDCHLGGFRWYFLCPLCRKRAAVLYSSDEGFLCRKCNHLAYEGQNEPKSVRGGIYRVFHLADKEERLINQVKRTHYNGCPTKKYRKLLQMQSGYAETMKEELQKEYNGNNNEKL